MPIKFLSFRAAFPTIAFFGGFLWDAMTIGRSVKSTDLWILAAYLVAAAIILWWLGYRNARSLALEAPDAVPGKFERIPYLLLQFLFGGLFSALFIFYIKSANHALALMYSLLLGALLIANEFIHDKYRRFTLTWTLFGLCTILLMNFVLPFLVGSVHFAWFYISTFAGVWVTVMLRQITPGQPGRIGPVWLIAIILAVAYPLDVIPPVPLVKREMKMGVALEKTADQYLLTYEKSSWLALWGVLHDDLHLPADQRIYCVSSIFAPSGLKARLYHHWQYYDQKKGWVGTERIGFDLTGGRDGGFRGYTYKESLWPGAWRVSVETESGRTVATHSFNLLPGAAEVDSLVVKVF